MCRNLIQEGTKFFVKDTIWWCPGKSLQTEDTWVWATQDRIGIVRHGDSSKEIDAQWTKKLKTMVKRRKDQKLRLRNFDARHAKIDTGAVVKSRKGLIGVERGKGMCYRWKEKRPVFEGRPVQFPAWERWSCTKTDTESRSTLWYINDTR